MKNMFLLFSFIILFITELNGQAAVDIPFSATDGTATYDLAAGLDLNATNCIDTLLGECGGLPPIPPTGLFDMRIDLTPYGCGAVSTCKDYRPPGNPPAFPFTGTVQHLLWFQVSVPGLPISITYNLPPQAAMRIVDNINGTFVNLGPFNGQGVAVIPGSYTVFGTRAFLYFDYTAIVPVEFTSFTAFVLQRENAVQLNWTTATEINNSGFEIQKQVGSRQSAVGNWEAIGFVPGFGTTTEPKSYSFIDQDVTTGSYKYRLKQIDFDGSFEYSNEIEVVIDFTPKEFVLYQNYPNPFNPATKIKYEIPSVIANKVKQSHLVSLKVYDVLSNEVVTLVNEEKPTGVYEVDFHSGGLPSGIYFYRLDAGQFSEVRKMTLIK